MCNRLQVEVLVPEFWAPSSGAIFAGKLLTQPHTQPLRELITQWGIGSSYLPSGQFHANALHLHPHTSVVHFFIHLPYGLRRFRLTTPYTAR